MRVKSNIIRQRTEGMRRTRRTRSGRLDVGRGLQDGENGAGLFNVDGLTG